MEKVKVTLEIPVDKLGELQTRLLAEILVDQDMPPVGTMPTVPSEAAPVPEVPADVAEISKTDLRAMAVKLTKAGKEDEIARIFSSVGAENLSGVDPKDYAKVYAEMEAVL